MSRLIAASVGGVLLCAVLCSSNSSVDAANKADALDNETIMKRLNRKKGNEGIHYQLKLKLDEEQMAWADVAKLSKEYADLTDALCKNPRPTKGTEASWNRLSKAYAAEAKSLDEAAGKKDKAGITATYEKLCKSCQVCHDEHR